VSQQRVNFPDRRFTEAKRATQQIPHRADLQLGCSDFATVVGEIASEEKKSTH